MPRFLGAATLALVACLTACAGHGPEPAKTGDAARRIVAIVPSLGQDLFAIGAGPQVVGVSAYTDLPARYRALPRVSDGSSVDAEKIVALRPDVVVGIPAQSRLVDGLRRAGIAVVLMPDDAYRDIFGNIARLGVLTGHAAQARAEIARLQKETRALQARTHAFVRRPSVFFAIGSAPIWTAGSGSYVETLIGLAGGRNAAGDLPQAWGEYGAEALLRAQPDIIVSDPATHLDAVLGDEPWRSLRAVREGRVYTVHPASILEQPGTHYTEGLHWLIERIAPLAQP